MSRLYDKTRTEPSDWRGIPRTEFSKTYGEKNWPTIRIFHSRDELLNYKPSAEGLTSETKLYQEDIIYNYKEIITPFNPTDYLAEDRPYDEYYKFSFSDMSMHRINKPNLQDYIYASDNLHVNTRKPKEIRKIVSRYRPSTGDAGPYFVCSDGEYLYDIENNKFITIDMVEGN